MSNLGFNHAMGAARMGAELGNMESRRRQAQTEMDRLNAQAQGAAIGSLVGTGVGMVKGGYDAYQENEHADNVEKATGLRGAFGRDQKGEQQYYASLVKNYGPQLAKDVFMKAHLPTAGGLSGYMERVGVVSPETRKAMDTPEPWRPFYDAARPFLDFIR